MKKEEVIAELTARGIAFDPEAKASDLNALLKEATDKEKAAKAEEEAKAKAEAEAEKEKAGEKEKVSTSEPVLLEAKGKFLLYQVGKGYKIMNKQDQLIESGEDVEAGRRAFYGHTRAQ